MVVFKRGYNIHSFNGEVYDVDTPYESLIWEEVAQKQGNKLEHRTWRYGKETAICLSCETSNNMVYLIENNGVVGRCYFCGCTFPVGPVELDASGHSVVLPRAELIDYKIVTVAEAAKICERIGQPMPTISAPERQMYSKTRRPAPKSLEDLAKTSQELYK